MIGYCTFCKKNVQVKELGAWYQSEGGMWLRRRGSWCKKCGMIISLPTKYAPDVAPVTSAEPDSGLESVPAANGARIIRLYSTLDTERKKDENTNQGRKRISQ